MVGTSLVKLFRKKGYNNIIFRKRSQLDLLDQEKTFSFLKRSKPDAVIVAAARVGGIYANNNYKSEFIYENLQIQNNLIHGSFKNEIKDLIFLGSSCIYPKFCKQPIKENYLLTSSLEPTNEPYAIAKISGLKMCEYYNSQYSTNYICLMPCNLYGPNDNYNLKTSHFLPAIIKKIHLAKLFGQESETFWGSGNPKRELMHVDDLSEACIHFLKIKSSHSLINIGSGEEYTIKQYIKKVSNLIGYKGKFNFDKSMPDGTPRKILNSSLAHSYSWYPKITFDDGLSSVYESFKKSKKNLS